MHYKAQLVNVCCKGYEPSIITLRQHSRQWTLDSLIYALPNGYNAIGILAVMLQV